jgi:3-methyladenine DNA glycosylase AlkD
MTKKKTADDYTALHFVERLMKYRSAAELKKIQSYFPLNEAPGEKDVFIGVRMGQVFALAKEFTGMQVDEIEKLLENPIHEIRAGAVSIMDFQARSKKTDERQRKALFDLYINRHDRINNWDLVDRSAPYVVGGYLYDKPRKKLYTLAKSKNVWERRTAIVSTYYFIRQNETDDTFKIAEILIHDQHDLIQKATGGWVREAGKRDPDALIALLNKYASTMPRITLRYATEHLDKKKRDYYLQLKNAR